MCKLSFRQRDTTLHLQKHIAIKTAIKTACYTFFFVQQFLHIFGPLRILYRKWSSYGIHTDGTEAFHMSCQINCRFDEGREAGEKRRNEVAARGWVLIKNRYITSILGFATADNNKPFGSISSRLFEPRLG